jgi:Cu/Ag efflux protein CusF
MRRGEEEMGRYFLIPAAFVLTFVFSSCEKGASETKPPIVKQSTPVATPFVPKDGNYDGAGEVTKINERLGSVELDHEEIKNLMPPMKMEFFVKDKALLKNLKVGDRVSFVVEYKHPQEIITSIKKAL